MALPEVLLCGHHRAVIWETGLWSDLLMTFRPGQDVKSPARVRDGTEVCFLCPVITLPGPAAPTLIL